MNDDKFNEQPCSTEPHVQHESTEEIDDVIGVSKPILNGSLSTVTIPAQTDAKQIKSEWPLRSRRRMNATDRALPHESIPLVSMDNSAKTTTLSIEKNGLEETEL